MNPLDGAEKDLVVSLWEEGTEQEASLRLRRGEME